MFILANNNFEHASCYFVHFFAVVAPLRHETSKFHEPALWSRWTQHKNCCFLFLNLDVDRYGPKENNFTKISQFNKIGEVWNSANRLLSDFISLLSSKNFATTAMWCNDFSSPLSLSFIVRHPHSHLEKTTICQNSRYMYRGGQFSNTKTKKFKRTDSRNKYLKMIATYVAILLT